MSICDIMVVMKLGLVQQIGEPQSIYDNPANLFVANFLGTPPINIFDGKIEGGKVYIGEEVIQDTDLEDRRSKSVFVPRASSMTKTAHCRSM